MPNPQKIELLNYHFSSELTGNILSDMLNKRNTDYSTLEELTEHFKSEPADKVQDSVNELCKREFLFEVKKPYGIVYAVNKLRISNMMFAYR